MRPGSTLRTYFVVLVGVQVVTSLAGIALLGRMSPAVARILAANEASVEAAEQMLAVLAARPADDRQRFLAALEVAEANVTEPAERPILLAVRARFAAALSGDESARAAVASSLLELSAINRQAMHRTDEDVRQLGLAGRWALAALALLGLLGSALALREVRRRLLAPLTELLAVLRARRSGDRLRRYVQDRETELSRVLAQVNDLMDAVDREAPLERGAGPTEVRAALGALLDRLGGARAVVDEAGELVAMSTETMELVATAGDELRRELREGDGSAVEERAPLGSKRLTLVTLRASG